MRREKVYDIFILYKKIEKMHKCISDNFSYIGGVCKELYLCFFFAIADNTKARNSQESLRILSKGQK